MKILSIFTLLATFSVFSILLNKNLVEKPSVEQLFNEWKEKYQTR